MTDLGAALRAAREDARVAYEWLVSDAPTVLQLRAGRRVGVGLVSRLEERVIELRHLDDVLGGGDLFPVVDKELSDDMPKRNTIELGDPTAAEPLLSRALDSYDENHAREVALYLSWLAEVYARTGLVDAARDALSRARRTARGVNSARLDLRLSEVKDHMFRRY